MKNRSWLTEDGIYSFKCSTKSVSCAMSFISYKDIIRLENRMLTGIFMLSSLSTFFISLFVHTKLKNMLKFKKRFYRNLNKNRLLCYYQPIISLETNKTVGCEVLCRYEDDDGKVVTPDKFLPLVKKKALTEKFTSIVVDKTFEELEPLLRNNEDMKVAFNFFPSDFDIVTIEKLLRKHKENYPLTNINIELTEDELIEAKKLTFQLNNIREKGYQVSIDDFGTGYSSLSYLKDINADYIKIDRSFIKDLEIGTVKSKLIPDIVSIISSIGSGIIAEGIENVEQLEYLKSLNVHFGQGYYFSRPLPVEDFKIYFEENN
jgi:sensor c-di-GMP phosphodiesterase-like protein